MSTSINTENAFDEIQCPVITETYGKIGTEGNFHN